jgi:hypothetical protein
MAEDRKATLDDFMENVNRLSADRHFREVLAELDENREDTLSLLAPDPATFLRDRGVQIPQDYRLSVDMRHEAATGGGGGWGRTCVCLVICRGRWCFYICVCRVVASSRNLGSEH